MIINKAYKFRLYPNKEQQELINKTFGCNRLVYNYYLNKKKEEYENNNKNISCFECIKDLLKIYVNYPFLKEIDSMSLRCSLFDLDNAYQKFFKEKIGYPKYKQRNSKNSYRTNYIKNTYKGKIYENIKLDLINKTITLPKLKEVKIRGYRKIKEIKGRIINATISKEKDNKYYVSVLFEEDIIVKQMIPTSIIGIDLGIKDLVITSNYEKYQNEKNIQKYEKRIKRKQKELSRKIKDSNNYYKTKQKIAKLYHKLTNARKYIIHKITKEIIDKNDIIVTENLKIKNMIKNHTIAKSLTDATLSEIIRQLEYKSKWKGKQLYKIDTYYPSSQICSKCGYQNKNLKDLKIREYICPQCGSNLDRDYNATENIMFEGIKKYMERLV
jgi:putative transposase